MFHFIHLTINSSSVPGPMLRSRDTRANERNSASSSRAPLGAHNSDRGGIRDGSLACNSGLHSLPGLPGRTEEGAGLGCFQWLEEAVFILRIAAATAAKSLQSCPTLCDPIDGSPLGSSVPEILHPGGGHLSLGARPSLWEGHALVTVCPSDCCVAYQGRGSLVGCCLWGRTESDTTEAT